MVANLVTPRLEGQVKLLADFLKIFEQPKSLSFYIFPETMEHSQDAHEHSVWLNKTGNICQYFSEQHKRQ